MATGGLDPAAREAELAHLPGPKLVDHLCTTHRRTDYEAVARVLDARDRRLEAALAENEDLRRKCDALLGGQRRRLEEAEEKPPPGIIAAPAPAPRDEQGVKGSEEGEVKGAHFVDLWSDDDEEEVEAGRGAGSRVPIREARDDAEWDEDDTVPLSQLWKRRRRGEPGAVKSEKGDGHNPVDSGGNNLPKCTSARTDVPEASTEQMVCRPGDSMVAAFVQGKGTVQPENVGGEMPRAVLHSPAQVVWSTLQKRKFGKKDGSSAVPGDTTSSQARSTSFTPRKEGSAAVPGYTTSSQARVHPLGIRNLSEGPELRNLNKGGGELSKKLVIEGSPRYGEKNNGAGSEKSSSPLRQCEGDKIIGKGASNEEPRVGRLSPSILSNYSTGEQIHSVSKNAELCSSTTKKALFEPGSSCTPLKCAIFPPSSDKSISIQAKREINLLPAAMTMRWETAAHMITSLKGNKELSMQALCSLYRQRKLVVMSTEGQQTGTPGLTKIDAIRAIKLSEFLLDGKLQGTLKRTAEELVSHDATGPTFLEKVALTFSKELFDIYKNKDDPYFC